MRSQGMDAQSDRLGRMPRLGSLAKISIGLIVIAIISSAFVYAETAAVDVNGVSYDVDYTGTGVTVSEMDIDRDDPTLLITANVDDPSGVLTITLNRNFYDATFDGEDMDFIILADGEEPFFTETKTTDSRTLNVNLSAGTDVLVEIIGNEFFGPSVTELAPTDNELVACTLEYAPVCGVDGVTYGNECQLNAANIAFDYSGECIVETPKTETPKTETPKTECGPGTILKDGVCVLDERCGPGTILEDGECVAEPVTESEVTPQGLGKQLVIGVVAAFVIAGIIGLVLAIMSKASKSSK